MSDIDTNLEIIIHAVKGEEVRQAIHDAIEDCKPVSTVTEGGTNAVNSTAVIAYINSLDASNISY